MVTVMLGNDAALHGGAYTFRPLLREVPLFDSGKEDVQITCLEFWEGNLYIGTSIGELLHFVSLPAEDPSEDATFILASRLEPTPVAPAHAPRIGIQKILIAPRSKKACILSNNVLTFHSLPELSPAARYVQVSECQWVGGLDLDLPTEGGPEMDVVMMGKSNLVRLLEIGEDVKGISKILFLGCLAAARRGRFACVADTHHYALLDVENKQKITLLPISTIDETPGAANMESLAPNEPPRERNTTFGASNNSSTSTAHRTQPSLSDRMMAGLRQAQPKLGGRERTTEEEEERVVDAETATRSPSVEATSDSGRPQAASPLPSSEQDKPLPPPPSAQPREVKDQKPTELLRPHIVSHLRDEFLLTTGTSSNEAGVGMFVNLEGDVVRGTLEFARYPTAVVVDSNDSNADGAETDANNQTSGGFVLASLVRKNGTLREAGVEAQRWDSLGANKSWISLESWEQDEDAGTESATTNRVGVVSAFTSQKISLTEVSKRLKLKRLRLRSTDKSEDQVPPSPATSNDDAKFWSRMDQDSSRILCWSSNNVYILVKNPLLVQLESSLTGIVSSSVFQQDRLLQLVGRITSMDATSEADFLSLAYMRQKISLVAFEDLVANRLNISPQISEKLFVESDLDPRVVISMVPLFKDDLDEGTSGIRLSQGLVDLVEKRLVGLSISLDPDEVLQRPDDYDVLGLIKRYLFAWRKKKGFASITDETHVFASVDAALLHLLLQQDAQAGLFAGQVSTFTVELYALLDQGVSCPERAIQLLEQYGRLYALSRLYGNRRASAKVLSTWQRIMEGEGDPAGEFSNPDAEMRRYLGFLRDRNLIEEYGAYLARRNPSFGVQVFTDESSKVKLSPDNVVQLLESKAPEAVKVFLEHLVFGKKNFQYANELITYYLNSVLRVLGDADDDSGRSILESSYQTYRALAPPKPTYRQFIAENGAAGLEWWNDRLRLLELLGGTFGVDFTYDVVGVQARVKDYSQWLVPESIILDGRQGNHITALRLLIHGLGDYHTAINYCMLGGASIFHPAMATAAGFKAPDRDEQGRLFSTVLQEFLKLEDETQQQEQVGILLGRFEGWFSVEDVLPIIPATWSLGVIEGFLVGAIRRLVQEKAETMITKALSGAENIIVSNEFAEKSQSGQPIIITEEEQVA